MNTPTHLVLNLAVLGTASRGRHTAWITAGALLPDLPMFFFYIWEKWVARSSEREIWGSLYFSSHWQDIFDLFNSIPIALAVLAAARLFGHAGLAWAAGAALLHFALDLPLHHDDGHRHFFPLLDWRYESPVSYWDPRHYGAFGAGLEIVALWCSSTVLWKRHPQRTPRVALAVLCTLSATGFAAFYVLGFSPV